MSVSFSAFQHCHSNDIYREGFRRSVLLSTVCTHTVLWSIMHVWWYIMLLMITTLLISFYCLYLVLILFLLLNFPSIYSLSLHFWLFSFAFIKSPIFSSSSCFSFSYSPLLPLFIHCHLFTPPLFSWALDLLLSSSLTFLHNVFLLSSPVRTCICYTHFLHELAWHLLIFPFLQPLTPITVVFH